MHSNGPHYKYAKIKEALDSSALSLSSADTGLDKYLESRKQQLYTYINASARELQSLSFSA
jgi:Fe-S cluster assembly scaffold protein SufB